MKYDNPSTGQWVYPTKKGYRLACCDCGLVHRMDFRLVKRGAGKIIQFRAFRDNRATGQMRRKRKRK